MRRLAWGVVAVAAVATCAWAGGSRADLRAQTDELLYRAPSSPGPVAATARWCGTAPSAADRLPEAVAGSQVHVIYAFPSDGADATAARAEQIVTDLSFGDTWWRGQDPTRTIRFDLFAFPGCDSELGLLDLSSARLPQNAAAYAIDPSLAIDRLAVDLALDDRKKYLVYYDGPVFNNRVCGISYSQARATGRSGVAIVFIGSLCGSDVGLGRLAADTALHELTHNLGAVPFAAPNTCQQSRGHVCDSQADLMYPFVEPLLQSVLDVNHDDYYGHAGAQWDVQDSPFLRRLDVAQLPLSVAVEGGGSVASDPPGIACPPGCTIGWDPGTTVNLEAEPAAGARFDGWGGACSGLGACAVTVDAAKSVTARFVSTIALRVVLAVRGGAAGTVRSSTGERCVTTCRIDVDPGTAVVLTALPARGSRFLGWTGACTGKAACRVTLSASASVGATFGPSSFALTATVAGRGVVTSAPRGLACRTRCSARFPADSTVTLRATAAVGWRFDTWTGDCRGRGRCSIRADRAHAVRARFVRV